ncbi:MAG TPA: DUF1559 domain-containing protein [Gemmata sp.]|nr:DUF1559 domain-containing protein [Gemmata sp.]
MSRRVAAVLVVFLGFLVVGLIITSLQKARFNSGQTASKNNLRELAFFAHIHANPDPKIDTKGLSGQMPQGTIVLPGVTPEDRLSWAMVVMPSLDQKRQDLAALLAQIDQTQPWPAEANQAAGRTPLIAMICPGATPKATPDSPAITCYVGIGGLAPPDPATLSLPPARPTPPRAGAFRYDAPTPFDRITDGLSQTLLMGECANEPGPWLRGGYSTVRGLDDSKNGKPLIGENGQFGGFFPNGGQFAMCDGGVRLFTPQTEPRVLFRLATIADGTNEVPID